MKISIQISFLFYFCVLSCVSNHRNNTTFSENEGYKRACIEHSKIASSLDSSQCIASIKNLLKLYNLSDVDKIEVFQDTLGNYFITFPVIKDGSMNYGMSISVFVDDTCGLREIKIPE